MNTNIFIVKESLSLIWYTANVIDDSLNYLQITIPVFMCGIDIATLKVYQGLLSVYLMIYKMTPLATFYCNTGNNHTISLTKHLYATVKLEFQ